jgi:predicted NACHT family NTPase
VILGDPGSGKSSLLRYLAVKWSQQDSNDNIPLLIELRHYMRSVQGQESKSFLDFIHHGSQWVGHLNQLELLNWLEEGKVILLLDGLDKIVDRQLRDTVMKQIHTFTLRFPKNIILITSRVHDYGSAIQELSHAGFIHYKLEDLDRHQIQDFLERWHEATYGPGVDKINKHDRLLQAIGHSKAIQELAANPLLLTLMAILNRAQELPRDRAHLYEKASEVLFHQWDVEAKLLQDPKLKNYPVEISFRDKRAMLRRVAFSMQNNSQGLAGNSITYSDLHECLKDYLETVKQAHNAPSIADVMIEQLRERNFAICFLGDDQYGFVHRTFLEYYCASELRYRFEKQRSLEFNDLRDEVFGMHWQDQDWHEVLRLICGMIEPIFAAQLIEDLVLRSEKEEIQTDALPIRKLMDYELATQYCRSWLGGLLLAAECCSEVSNLSAMSDSRAKILIELQSKIKCLDLNIDADLERLLERVNSRAVLLPFIVQSVASWTRYPEVLPWLNQVFTDDAREPVRSSVVNSIASNYNDDDSTLPWLKRVFIDDAREPVRSSVVNSIASNYNDDDSTLPWLKQVFIDDVREPVRSSVVNSIASNYNDDDSTLPWLKQVFIDDAREQICSSVVSSIASNYKDDELTLPWLKQVFIDDEREPVRSSVVNSIVSNYKDDELTLPWLEQVFIGDESEVIRKIVLTRILSIAKGDLMLPWLDRIFSLNDHATLNVLTSADVMTTIAIRHPHMIEWYIRQLADEVNLAKDAAATPKEYSKSIAVNLRVFSSLGMI